MPFDVNEKLLAASMVSGAFPSANTEYGIEEMVNGDNATAITMYVFSTFNQTVNFRVIGARGNNPRDLSQALYVGQSYQVAAGNTTMVPASVTVIPLAHGMHSYYGVSITTNGTAPTAGTLQVVARCWIPRTSASPTTLRFGSLDLDQDEISTEVQDIINQIISHARRR